MLFSTTLVALVSLAVSSNAARIHRRHDFAVPDTYDAPWLEPYQNYHIRYLALSCHTQHNTTFFDSCCHPLLKDQKLEDRPAQCTPSPAAASSASVAAPSSTIVPDDKGNEDLPECDDEPATDAPANVAADPASTEAPAATSSVKKHKDKTTKEATSTEAPPPAPPAPTPAKNDNKGDNKDNNKDNNSGGNSGLFGGVNTKGQVHTGGIGTFYYQNGVAGNCGKVNQDSDMLIALPTNTYAGGSLCGKKVAITNTKTGVTAVGVVADSCPTCDNDDCLDLSTGLYGKFASQNDGVFPLAWALVDE